MHLGALQPALAQADNCIGFGKFVKRWHRMCLDAQGMYAAGAWNAVGINGANSDKIVAIIHTRQARRGFCEDAVAQHPCKAFVLGQLYLVAHGTSHGRQGQADPVGIFCQRRPGRNIRSTQHRRRLAQLAICRCSNTLARFQQGRRCARAHGDGAFINSRGGFALQISLHQELSTAYAGG